MSTFRARSSKIGRRGVAGALLCCAVVCGLVSVVNAADWPVYGADASRSCRTDEILKLPLEAAWTYLPGQAPRPAWPEPGKELHRLDFDYAPQPVLAHGLVYVGSSADDTVRALDAATGAVRWHFTTGGPVRFAPAIAGGKAYVVSDDGWLYALDAVSGALAWKFHGAPRDDQVLGNGRMISRWPIRCGPAIVDGVVYVAAGMWPAHGIFVYAVDARTGEQIWCNDSSGSMYRNQPHGGSSAFTGVCPQGYMLAAGDLLLVPSGRSTPAAFDRKTGALVYYQPYLYMVPYGSESWGNRGNGGWWLAAAGASFLCSMHEVGAPELDSHVGEAEPRDGDGIVLYSLATGLREFNLPQRYRALAAGDTLYATGKKGVEAIDLKAWCEKKKLDACVKWTTPHPRAYCLALAGTTLLVGSQGALTAFDGATGKRSWSAAVDGQVRGLAVAGGRVVAATSKGSVVCFESREISVPPVTVHEIPAYVASAPGRHVDTAARIVKESGVSQGYALVVGERDSRLATALASRTDLHVICVLPPGADVDGERARLLSSPFYGSRVVIQSADGSGLLPYAPYFADLIVMTGDAAPVSGDELYRVLRPCGGVMCFPGVTREDMDRLLADVSAPRAQLRSAGGLRMLIRGRLPGAGEWRSQRADGGNTGIGKESLVRAPFDILWFGGPGPDRMMSRHWGASAPLSVAGRVFVAGQHHVIAFDAYNGRELWCRELRGVGRMDADTAASNFVADDTSIYAAVGPACHRLDQATGKTLAVYRVPDLDVAEPRASASGPEPASVDVEWPAAWQLFGPVPKASPVPPPAMLQSIPAELTVGTKTFQPRTVRPVKGKVDFTHYFGGYGFSALAPDEKPEDHPRDAGESDSRSEGALAYLFAEIECPSAGKLTVGAGSDWWMQWFLDGKPVYDTLKNGNSVSPYGVTNHVFSVGVTKGKHVLAVMVKAGSRGWCLFSVGGAKYDRNLRRLSPERMLPRWGYLSVAGDLVLGSYVPGGPKRHDTESSALFALHKQDGSLRWAYRPQRAMLNMSVAFGDDRAFMLDGTAPSQLFGTARSRLPGGARRELTLLALDLKTGAELWRQDDVPSSANEWLHHTMRFVQYARQVVTLGGSAAYDAATGKKLWQRTVSAAAGDDFRLPVIRDDWVIAEPRAYDLRTGEPRMVKDALTGQLRPWKFTRAYGCGPIAGCENILFFRSGTAGFYDFATEGTTTWGGVRPGCSITMLPANGLMILPEGSSGCSCAYNFQTSLALVSAGDGARRSAGNPWNVFHGERTDSSLRRLSLNFGAPGDRRDSSGVAWLAFPRPVVPGASPVPFRIVEGAPEYSCRNLGDTLRNSAEFSKVSPEFVRASGLRGPCKMVVDLARPPVGVTACGEPPKLDGVLDDPCWKGTVPFEADAHLLAPAASLFMRRDAQNLYVAFSRAAGVRGGKPVSFAGSHAKKDDKDATKDDSVVISLTDKNRSVSLDFAISCAGGTCGRKHAVGAEAVEDVAGEEGPEGAKRDTLWHGEWQAAAKKDAQAWSAEAAIPLATLQVEGLDLASLQVNCTARNTSGQGPASIALTTASSPQRDRRAPRALPGAFVPVVPEAPPVLERKYTVRLHFAETGADIVAQAAFSVELQGKLVLDGQSLVGRTVSSPAVVKEFTGVSAGEKMTLSLVPAGTGAETTRLCLCGMEVIAEDK